MRTIRIPEDFVPAERFRKEASHWLEWVEVSGRPVVVTRRGRAVAVVVGPDEYFGMSENLGVLKSLAAEMQRGSPPLGSAPKAEAGARRSSAGRRKATRARPRDGK